MIFRSLVFLLFLIPVSLAYQPEEMHWNRYLTDNFEILSVDNNQGKYLHENVEFIKLWITWRWGIKNFDFPVLNTQTGESIKVRCKLICVNNAEVFERLFNRKTPTWRVEVKNGVAEYSVWLITDGEKWNTKIPTVLTEVMLNNFEASTKSKLPLWSCKGMSVLNSRFVDIKTSLSFVDDFDSKLLLNMTLESYNKLSDMQKISFDAQSALFCLWVKKEFGGKLFLDFLSGSMINPEYCLQYFNIKTYVECDSKVKFFLLNLPGKSDSYLTW